jgi:hypothetical protein
MTLYFTFMALIVIMISAFIIYITYNHVIDTWFSDKGEISYDTLIKQIQTVSKDNYFMNYGLWGSQGSQGSPGFDLKDANTRLV